MHELPAVNEPPVTENFSAVPGYGVRVKAKGVVGGAEEVVSCLSTSTATPPAFSTSPFFPVP